MKFLLTPLLCLLGALCIGQNSAPLINILSIDVDEVAQELSLVYQLTDADGDPCEVWLKYSTDGATYFERVPEQWLTGDAGAGIAAGEALSLVWNYADINGEIGDVHIQLWASDHQEVDIADMVAQVDEAQLLSYLQSVEGVRHYISAPAHLAAVRNLMLDAFSDAGLQTEGHHFVHAATDMQNVLGRKPGAKDEAITFIIDGHFDGVPGSPAADDNGSAVAGVLEALRILSQYHFEHSIRFIGFDAEELGIIGSHRYVQNGIKAFEDIQGVLNFEMIGYYSDEPNTQMMPFGFDMLFPNVAQEIANDDYRGNFITVVGNTNSNPLIAAYVDAAESYVPDLRVITVSVPGTGTLVPDLRRSDHARFWDVGIPALMLTDGADFRNLNYHTPGDVISTLDFNFMKQVVQATLATAAQLAVPISASHEQADLSTILSVHDHVHHFPAGLKLFPNPSDGAMTLQITDSPHQFRARLEIFSVSGRQVHRELMHFPEGTSSTTLNLRKLSPGTYILNLHTGDASTSAGFVVR